MLSIKEFLQCCEIHPEVRVSRPEFFEIYKKFYKNIKQHYYSRTVFYRIIRGIAGVQDLHMREGDFFEGICLKKEISNPANLEPEANLLRQDWFQNQIKFFELRNREILRIGEFIFKNYFNNNLEEFRHKRPNKQNSIRKLANRDDCIYAAWQISRMVNIYLQEKQLEEWPQLTISHKLRLLVVKDDVEKKRYAKRIIEEGLTIKQLCRILLQDGQSHSRKKVREKEEKKMRKEGKVGEKYTAFGKIRTLKEWELEPECDVLASVIYKRIHTYGWKVERAISEEKHFTSGDKKAVKYKAFGEEKIGSVWIKDQRCVVKNVSSLMSRLRVGWSVEEALTTPIGARRQKWKKSKPQPKKSKPQPEKSKPQPEKSDFDWRTCDNEDELRTILIKREKRRKSDNFIHLAEEYLMEKLEPRLIQIEQRMTQIEQMLQSQKSQKSQDHSGNQWNASRIEDEAVEVFTPEMREELERMIDDGLFVRGHLRNP